MDTCVFCEATGDDFKPEHWVSQWISRALIPEGKGVEHHVPGREPWLERIVDLTVDHVCSDCNHHWLSDIETKIRDVALPLIEGDPTPRTLLKADMRRLAAWCFLKLISLELGRPSDQARTYPDEIYSGFKRFKHPPHGCSISIGYREISEDPPHFVWFRSQGHSQADEGLGYTHGYTATVTISHFVVHVLGIFAAASLKADDLDERFLEIWPEPADNLNWPPSARFKGIVNNDLV